MYRTLGRGVKNSKGIEQERKKEKEGKSRFMRPTTALCFDSTLFLRAQPACVRELQ